MILLPFWPVGMALALWCRARGEGWYFSPWWGRIRRVHVLDLRGWIG